MCLPRTGNFLLQVMLYHLAQDVAVPIAVPTPGANKFAFDTASTLQCSVGPSLPNNRIIARKTPQAIYLQHGTGNATIVSQPISYCGGEVTGCWRGGGDRAQLVQPHCCGLRLLRTRLDAHNCVHVLAGIPGGPGAGALL